MVLELKEKHLSVLQFPNNEGYWCYILVDEIKTYDVFVISLVCVGQVPDIILFYSRCTNCQIIYNSVLEMMYNIIDKGI